MKTIFEKCIRGINKSIVYLNRMPLEWIGILVLVCHFVPHFILKEKSKIQIIDATFSCAQTKERFYEDDKHIYSFPCGKSSSIYVKFENGNKMLVTDALNSEQVTIEQLIDAGLEVYTEDK